MAYVLPPSFPRILAALCMVAGLGLMPKAEAAITCKSGPTEVIVKPWAQTGLEWAVTKNTTINTAIVEYTYTLQKTGSTAEEVAFEAHWINGASSSWYPEANARGFFGGAQGYGLSMMFGNGNFVTNAGPAYSTMTLPSAGTYQLKTTVYYSLKKVSDTTTEGLFGVFASPLAYSAQVRTNGNWTTPSGCLSGAGTDLHTLALGVGLHPAAPKPSAVCTLNKGQGIAIKLPAVEAIAMNNLGALPVNYQKHEYSLHYVCTGTGGVVNPNYRIGLIGTKAGTTNALQSSNPNVGVVVEAVDSRGSAPQSLVPGSTTSASQVRLYDAGQSGGATMKLLSYPVRSAGRSAGDVQPGAFNANGTLRVFTD
ncbi:hypothetical protein QLQ15_13335 [Lysobacter sp. LF1]|uniref:Fimbrial-type adhesion domain-containing protein n=1 Tax=Lysobacter stagni TaxID=3045172 RepID=A0ABT6XIB2_9GAMM|nr:fimbrial protein [Lysobacter sp. LF1]MDI9239889.1 hypothetical protein [Lysobacter sp. LF1]